ncbi:MAG: hypothetical protein C0399_08910 [Syntrophus sp. (in: bacteria)]|nr:hypothetical protein [Syntrophus sp. (in: bacteria)]
MIQGLRILILSPTVLPDATGNAVTAERWRRLLESAGAKVLVVASEKMSGSSFRDIVQQFEPHLIHAHQAIKSGTLLLELKQMDTAKTIPRIVSVGGTDVNLSLHLQKEKAILDHVFKNANIIITQSRVMESLLTKEFSGLEDRLCFVPRSPVWLGDMPSGIRATAGCGPDSVLFFLPAGIRSVKGNLKCLEYFEKVYRLRGNARILFSGPPLDEKYSALFAEKVFACRRFAMWIPAFAPEAMRSAYEGADVVLNTSVSEGLSTVLLEAISAGRPVLASDIPGNRWLLNGSEEGLCGLLYNSSDSSDFVNKAVSLIDDDLLRQSLQNSARAKAITLPSPEEETKHLLAAYRIALQNYLVF